MKDESEIQISDILEKFAVWKDRNFFKMDINSYVYIYDNGLNAKRFNYKELIEKFLTNT